MKVVKEVLTALLIVIIVLLAIFLTVAIGYYFGILLSVLPFVSGWLTSALPITAGQIPAITAWLAVAGVFIGSSAKVSANMGEGGDGEK